jgi:hypothetical protein
MALEDAEIETLKSKIAARREEMLRDWTPEACPEEHQEGWLAWEYALRTLREAGVPDEHAKALRSVWMGKVNRGFYGTYGAILAMLKTPAFVTG